MNFPERLPPSIVGFIVVLAFLLGVWAGWFIRLALETRAELSVVLDDEQEVAKIREESDKRFIYLHEATEGIRNDKTNVEAGKPLPDSWYDGLLTDGEPAE